MGRVTPIDGLPAAAVLLGLLLLSAAASPWSTPPLLGCIGIVMIAVAAISAKSVALAEFGLDSLIEIGVSVVVIWEPSGTGEDRRHRALRLIGVGFGLLAAYLLVQYTWTPAGGFRPHHSPLGIGWTAVMFALAAGKARTGNAPVLGGDLLDRVRHPVGAAATSERTVRKTAAA